MTVGAPRAGFELTDDAFLGGRLSVLQPKTGYRAGVDAVLLAAAVTWPEGGAGARVLDCGAGVGTVGLCVAARLAAAKVVLVEREADLAALAEANATRNHVGDRVRVVTGDLTAAAESGAAPRLAAEQFDIVLANPPFHATDAGTQARDPRKMVSHAMAGGALSQWSRFAARMAKPGGRVLFIHKADALDDLLQAFAGRFGGLMIRPIYPKRHLPAIRVLVEGQKGSRAPLTLLPPLVLHGEDGGFAPYVSRILREGAALDGAIADLMDSHRMETED